MLQVKMFCKINSWAMDMESTEQSLESVLYLFFVISLNKC